MRPVNASRSHRAAGVLRELACLTSLAIVDLETTGGHITRDRITEIGILLVDGDQVRPGVRWSIPACRFRRLSSR